MPSTASPVPFDKARTFEPSASGAIVWSRLYERRIPQLQNCASAVFLAGLEAVGLRPDRVPTLESINEKLEPLTRWRAVGARGFLPPAEFFGALAARRFPTVTRLRGLDELDYTPEPDLFHDVFGHVPMHAHPAFADFLQGFGTIAVRAQTETERQRLTRLFWFTVEFGILRERGEVKVYGSGLISSHGECAHALGPDCLRRGFDLGTVLEQPFRHDQMQPVLFVIDSFAQLFDAIAQTGQMLDAGMLDEPGERRTARVEDRGDAGSA